jgi:hypothetical protein
LDENTNKVEIKKFTTEEEINQSNWDKLAGKEV